ncbi:MAG: 16S rRNA (uracil(1498)-N(3))-methyltransferase [Deltaproteobacteria bacterium]|nr:16S rRNA (uracil(1498)-N(3))-methyltransferase [Deltaproteobacteria bacterium]MBW1816042.1 16S rRNA (uracil(1498)-N(3))-methyltransferase [Deltaproteobacteria bacterium]MBW2285087.1 16S rRNA (uracil(1498)-N(3))-methyltransferase [Deltaproteobacteria bacterium]
MKRFFVNDIQVRDGRCAIRGSEAGHISRVMRMGPGERFILMDGKGRRYRALIERSDHREVVVALERTLPVPEPSPLTVDLCQALLKSRAMDYLVRKTSELGVDVIRPFSSARTVVRLKGERAERRLRHWREIAQNAAKQSDRISPARIESPIPFSELVSRWGEKEAFKVIFWEAEEADDLKGLISTSGRPDRFAGIIGPEGGFSREEVDMARNAGFRPASLGRRVLRAETAAVTMVAIVQYEWGDLSLARPLNT